MDLPCQLFPQSTVVLLPAFKQDEGKGRAEARADEGPYQSDVSLWFGPSPLPRGEFSWLGTSHKMSCPLIWFMS